MFESQESIADSINLIRSQAFDFIKVDIKLRNFQGQTERLFLDEFYQEHFSRNLLFQTPALYQDLVRLFIFINGRNFEICTTDIF